MSAKNLENASTVFQTPDGNHDKGESFSLGVTKSDGHFIINKITLKTLGSIRCDSQIVIWQTNAKQKTIAYIFVDMMVYIFSYEFFSDTLPSVACVFPQ